MSGGICFTCMLWIDHKGKCTHNPAGPCRSCAGPLGYRWLTDDGTPHEPADQCARCWQATLEAVA